MSPNKSDDIHDIVTDLTNGMKAWADYWALTVPTIPLLQSKKMSKSCSCNLCRIAEKDVTPALAGWLRANATPYVSSEVIRDLSRANESSPHISYFNELMGELEIQILEKHACSCRVPELRNEAVKGVRKLHKQRDQESLSESEERLPSLSPSIEGEFIANAAALSIMDDAYRLLAPREWEVFKLLVEEASYKEISDKLGIALGTVGAMISRIRKKIMASINQSSELVKNIELSKHTF